MSAFSSLPPPLPARIRVLLVDDNLSLLKSSSEILRHHGHDVTVAESGQGAIEQVTLQKFDVILTDIAMPKMDGVQLLRQIRAHDLDVPIVLVTGQPAVETAVKAVEYGAYKYLSKPVPPKDLLAIVEEASRVCKLARARRLLSLELGNNHTEARDLAGLEANLEGALDSLWMAYQPILSRKGEVYGYETLLRTSSPAFSSPPALVSAAEALGRTADLGRSVRSKAPLPMCNAPETGALFINLHPLDLTDPDLLDRGSELGRMAERVVLEITERAGLPEISNSKEIVRELRARGFRIAIDDLGSGYAGLNSLAILEPDVVKLDMVLVRDIQDSLTKRKLVSTVTSLCRDMGAIVVAEGIESLAEEETLLKLGCDLFQGYRYAKPGRPFPELLQVPGRPLHPAAVQRT